MKAHRIHLLAATLVAIGATFLVPGGDAQAQKKQPPEQKEATKLFKEGRALAQEKKYVEAIEKFNAAYEMFPDPALLFVTGEAYQVLGNTEAEAGNDKVVFEEHYPAAIEKYKKFIEIVGAPDGKEGLKKNIPEAEKRISQLEEGIASYHKALQEEEEAKAAAEEAEKQRLREEEEERLRKIAERKGMQLAVDGMVMAGLDQDLTGLARMVGGGLLGWGGFMFEGHISIDGFLRIEASEGTSATSASLLDLGVRWGPGYRNVGPFVSAGASYGVFFGKPRERKIKDNAETCAIVDSTGANSCVFAIDANIATRIGFGYGFKASEKSTVAARLDLQYWFFSVDGSQPDGSPPPGIVEKPQTDIAVLVGLEFMSWK